MKSTLPFFQIRNLSIKYKLILAFVLIVLIPFMLLVGFYAYYIQNVLKDRVIANHKEITKQAGQSINIVLKDMLTTARLVVANNDMNEVLSNNIYDDPVNIFANIKMINNFFTDMRYSVLNYENSFVALKDGYSNIHISRGYVQTDIRDAINEFLEKNMQERMDIDTKWIGAIENNFVPSSSGRYLFTLIKCMPYDFREEKRGVIMVCVDESNFLNIIRSGSSDFGIRYYIIDENGKILSSNVRDHLAKQYDRFNDLRSVFDGNISFYDDIRKKEVINTYKLSNGNWRLVEVIPYSVIYKDLKKARTLFIGLGSIFLVLFVIVSITVLSKITKPMIDLTKAMNKVQNGDLSVSVVPHGMDEVGQLSDAFNNMIIRISRLIETINEEEKEKREAELKMLRAQIKPHFLFNTLSSIRWVAEMNQAKPVSELIVALSSLLKSSIMNGKEFVTLQEEIENLKNYCKIQEARYGGISEVKYDMDEATSNCKVLNLMLQPIVENSLMHGFEGLSKRGVVEIKSEIVGRNLVIKVMDNGKGMNREQIAKVFAGTEKRSSGGIGILNVHERLKKNFGADFGIDMSSEPDKGVTTIISIPILADKETLEDGKNIHY